MAKLPDDRPASMDVVVAELEACLAELDAKDGGEGTMIMKRPKPAKSRPAKAARAPRRRQRSGGLSFPVLPVLFGLLLLAAVAGGISLATRDDAPGSGAAGGQPVQLEGVASFDPQGDDKVEHPERVGDATDNDPATYWTTSTYEDFSSSKQGVGLVLDAGSKRALRQIAVTTDTPGFTAEIQAGSSRSGPFQTVGESKAVGAATTWDLDGTEAQYYVIWITDLNGSAHVNEVKAS
jgi:hypothetical protein